MRVAIVGAGIIGTSIAQALAARGERVTVFDRRAAGCGVSADSFGWINVGFAAQDSAAELKRTAAADYRRLDAALGGGLGIEWCGALAWRSDPAETEHLAYRIQPDGRAVRLIEQAEVACLEPDLVTPPQVAVFAPGDGAMDVRRGVSSLASAARDAGARIVERQTVSGLITNDARVSGLVVDGRRHTADAVIVAAGIGSADLCDTVGVRLAVEVSPAVLMRFATSTPLASGIMTNDEFEVRQESSRHLIAAAAHESDTAAIARRTATTLSSSFHGGEQLRLDMLATGRRPMPTDGPIAGPVRGVPGLYVAVVHSGVTLAATVGRRVAAAVIDAEVAV